MAIIKRSRSGKAVLFVCDCGDCYLTSVKYLEGLTSGRFTGMSVLTKFPQKVNTSLFKQSPLIGEEYSKDYSQSGISDHSVAKRLDDKKQVGDLEEW